MWEFLIWLSNPMGQLIGAPLKAASDSQILLAQSTADFIKTVGFKMNEKGEIIDTQTVKFKYKRTVPNSKGEMEKQNVEIDVPLIAIVNVPNLQIDNVDISFDMSVNNVESTTSAEDSEMGYKGQGKVGWGPFSLSVEVSGSVSSHKENTRKTDQSAKYHVSVQASQAGTPEGLSRVLDLMMQSITPNVVDDKDKEDDEGGDNGGDNVLSA